MKLKIDTLLEITDIDNVVKTLVNAFEYYPKLVSSFPEKNVRMYALEASTWYYAAYDMYYGNAYALDQDGNEVVTILESGEMDYTKEKCMKAGSISKDFLQVMEKLTIEDREKWAAFYEDLDLLEKEVPFPPKFLYINYLGVIQEKQGKGHGRKLMMPICHYAKQVGLPIVLFTNTDQAKAFYKSLGFEDIKTVTSEKYGFSNTYMIWTAF